MKKLFTILSLLPLSMAIAGWNPFADQPSGAAAAVHSDAVATVEKFKIVDPKLKTFFDKAYGYAVFPTVSKAGFGLGGAYGEGYVYKKSEFIGSSTLTQITIGFQIGGQAYSEIIFFKDKSALDKFTDDDFEIGAQISAILLNKGASADADYSDGVAVFTLPKGGLMYEAAIGGQKFNFEPK
ncbi:MAG: lipid-binding SYLF domain-containing protein [Candidatus Thioglobus sp.]|nr:lipid-binding SYLF domain-containing protein [Candidatus Thioglobus sp.]